MQNKIDITPEVAVMESSALVSYYENRTLILSQKLSDVSGALNSARGQLEELRDDLARATQPEPGDDDDRALAALLREFVSANQASASAVDSLFRDAKRVINARDGEGV